ncbi:MAG: hypothetical protein SFZ23_11590 [Planctomycetota bacterium]|nr:hypothetical protein [Planctomycetota bacterium]
MVRQVISLALITSCGVMVSGCDQQASPGTGSGTSSGATGGSTSLLGKSRDMAKDVAADAAERQAAVAGAAQGITGGSMADVGPVSFPVPDGWRSVPPANPMRAAEMRFGEGEGECLVTFSLVRGDVASNIERWRRQVTTLTGEPVAGTQETRTISGKPVTTIELEGVFTDQMTGRSATPDWMVRGAVVELGGGQLAAVKMTGPSSTMRQAAQGWTQLVSGMQSR